MLRRLTTRQGVKIRQTRKPQSQSKARRDRPLSRRGSFWKRIHPAWYTTYRVPLLEWNRLIQLKPVSHRCLETRFRPLRSRSLRAVLLERLANKFPGFSPSRRVVFTCCSVSKRQIAGQRRTPTPLIYKLFAELRGPKKVAASPWGRAGRVAIRSETVRRGDVTGSRVPLFPSERTIIIAQGLGVQPGGRGRSP